MDLGNKDRKVKIVKKPEISPNNSERLCSRVQKNCDVITKRSAFRTVNGCHKFLYVVYKVHKKLFFHKDILLEFNDAVVSDTGRL
ncbi:hypothetical protein B7P43_G12581 [Cryptotermes secundus]|uniref:Uncharacterized protein n=1 Tax=Cryptotermes secundus TaxID=105785 RepID=A0A2J7Q9L5_9NEOP|nr:hypothetical protein B7P43_G12581 [Cryptotermes secundus]